MILGYTGTRRGMTRQQLKVVREELRTLGKIDATNSGDCQGGDAQFHAEAVKLRLRTIGFPSNLEYTRAHCKYDYEWDPKSPLERNHDIVNHSHRMIATPKEKSEVLRSGTWATIRYAKKVHKSLLIIYPDGTFETTDWR